MCLDLDVDRDRDRNLCSLLELDELSSFGVGCGDVPGLSLCLVLDFDLDRDRNLCWSFLKLEELSSLRIVECGDVRRLDIDRERDRDRSVWQYPFLELEELS